MIRKYLAEGGNVFQDVSPIKKEYVPGIINEIQGMMPDGIKIIPHIGSAGFKVESGDMDVFIDAATLAGYFGTKDEKTTRAAMKKYMEDQFGLQSALSGRNVHVRMPVPDGSYVQVDLMIIPNAERVAPFHQHGPSGQYNDPSFKGGQLFILYSSLAKALGLKFSPFEGLLVDRATNEVVADNKDAVAKILLNPAASAKDLANVNTILAALANDPHKEQKLAQAREDAKKGLITLPESKQRPDHWYRQTVAVLESIEEDAPSPHYVNSMVDKKQWNMLGNGMTGSVWEHMADPHTVVKIVGGGSAWLTPSEKKGAIAFVHFCVDHGDESEHFPIIYGINVDDPDLVQIRIERLEPLKIGGIGDVLEVLSDTVDMAQNPSGLLNPNTIDVDDKDQLEELRDDFNDRIEGTILMRNTFESVLHAIVVLKLNGPHYAKAYGLREISLDLHEYNWMMRPDGTIVAVDPWYIGN